MTTTDRPPLVAVTGASGHLGATVVRALLARGDRVRVLILGDDDLGLRGLPVERVGGSVTDPAAVARLVDGVDRLYHLAALISIDPADDARVHATNVGGARTVVAACRAAGTPRLVHVSSIHALASAPEDRPVTEERPLAEGPGLPAYDASKAAAEQIVRDAIADGLDAVILNPTGIIGPDDLRPSHMGEALLRMATGRMPALVSGAFDWVDARDVAAGILAAADRAPAGSRYLLGGHRASVAELAALADRATGRHHRRVVLPMWMARAAAPGAVLLARRLGQRPLFSPGSLHALRHHREVSHALAERELGYRPRPLAETVADTIASFIRDGRIPGPAPGGR